MRTTRSSESGGGRGPHRACACGAPASSLPSASCCCPAPNPFSSCSFKQLKRQSKARDEEVFGKNDGKKKKGKPVLAAIDRLAKERGSDPFMLKSGGSASARVDDDDVDAVR